MTITGDTITAEQISAVWRLGCGDGCHGDPDTMHAATVAANAYGDFTAREQREARARCAEILTARAAHCGGVLCTPTPCECDCVGCEAGGAAS